jgi:uncharacterized membrane protein YidH (DUF202 family)
VARFGLFLREIEAVRDTATVKPSTGLSLWIGTALILLGVAVNLLLCAEHVRLMRQIHVDPPYGIRSWILAVALSLLLALLGITTAIYLVIAAQ